MPFTKGDSNRCRNAYEKILHDQLTSAELSKHKKSLLATCSQAHNAKQAEATAEWAVGRRSVRPGTSENVFAAALSRTPTRAKGAMAGLMSRLNKA